MSSRSIDSAPRSSISVASGVTSSSSAPRAPTTASRTASYVSVPAVLMRSPPSRSWGRYRSGQRAPGRERRGGPAVDDHERSGHVTGVAAREEHDQVRDVFDAAERLERNLLEDPLAAVLRDDALDELRRDEARKDGVDPDAEAGELERAAAGERVDGALRRRVVRLAEPAALAHDGRDVHDRALALGHELPEDRLRAVEDAAEVHAHHVEPVARLHVVDERVLRDPRVVDEDVEPAERLDRACDRGLPLVVVGDVAADRDGGPARGLDLADDLLRLFLPGPVVDADGRTLGGEGDADRASDPPRATGYERPPPLELHAFL